MFHSSFLLECYSFVEGGREREIMLHCLFSYENTSSSFQMSLYFLFSSFLFPIFSFFFFFQAFGFSCSLHAKCILNYWAMALKSHSEAERRRRERINGHLAVLRSTDKVVGSSPSLLLGCLFAPFLD